MSHPKRRATDQGLTWAKAKDAILMGLVSLVVSLLLYLAKGQIETNASLGDLKRDLAVVTERSKEYKQDLKDLRARLLALEASQPRSRFQP